MHAIHGWKESQLPTDLPRFALILELLGQPLAQIDKEDSLEEPNYALGADVGFGPVGRGRLQVEGETAGVRRVVDLNTQGQFDDLCVWQGGGGFRECHRIK